LKIDRKSSNDALIAMKEAVIFTAISTVSNDARADILAQSYSNYNEPREQNPSVLEIIGNHF
jgi:hypothetical protein